MVVLIVVEGPEPAYRRAVDDVVALGWQPESGFAPPYRSGHIVRVGPVANQADAQSALLVALSGLGMVGHATADREIVDRLVDDLRRLGPVDHRVGPWLEGPTVDVEIRALLGLLAEGHSLGEAAGILGLSRRTADRRLARGRQLLGTNRTTEAIARATRLGWLAPDPNRRD